MRRSKLRVCKGGGQENCSTQALIWQYRLAVNPDGQAGKRYSRFRRR